MKALIIILKKTTGSEVSLVLGMALIQSLKN